MSVPAPHPPSSHAPTLERTFVGPDVEAAFGDPDVVATDVYRDFAPPPDLAPWVARIFVCDERIAPGTTVLERVLPDGMLGLQFSLADVPVSHDVDAAPVPVGHAAEVLGARRAASMVRLSGSIEGIGVQLRPGATEVLLGAPAGAFTGQSVSLDVPWGAAFTRETMERLADAPHGPARAATLVALLRRRMHATSARRAGQGAATAAVAMSIVARTGGRATVRELADRLGVGERRVEQLFHRHVGLSPKVAARIARFRLALRMAREAPGRRWSDIAFAAGYADQAHLVHEFRAISGLPPRALREAPEAFGFPQDEAGSAA
jgi:AraC-like DNA-binding protein